MPPASRASLLWAGAAALVGAAMWAFKSVAILATGNQPDYWFELALAFFGISTLLLVYGLKPHLDDRSRLSPVLGWIAALAGVAAAVAYTTQGDDGLFGPAALVTVFSIIVTLFMIGSQVRKRQLLPRYSLGATLLAWLFIASIPIGAVLSTVDDRLLEVGLMGVVAGWVIVGLAALQQSHPKSGRRSGPKTPIDQLNKQPAAASACRALLCTDRCRASRDRLGDAQPERHPSDTWEDDGSHSEYPISANPVS